MRYNHAESDKKEDYISYLLTEMGYFPKVFRPLDSNGKRIAQTISPFGKYKIAVPDIDVYETEDAKNAVLRVEVKGFVSFPEIRNMKYLIVESRKFDNYMEYFRLSEVETRIIFVVGENKKKYECYWEEIENMNNTIFAKDDYTFSNGNIEKCLFWKPSDLHSGLGDFC